MGRIALFVVLWWAAWNYGLALWEPKILNRIASEAAYLLLFVALGYLSSMVWEEWKHRG